MKQIKDYPNYYVDIDGSIYNKLNGFKKLKWTSKNNTKYPKVNLYNNEGRKWFSVHRLVALAFLPNSDKRKIEVNHIDHNKENNHVSNLEWVTPSENIKHAVKNGKILPTIGEINGQAKINKETALEIRKLYDSGMRICEIQRKMNLSRSIVSKVAKRKRWKHLQESRNQ